MPVSTPGLIWVTMCCIPVLSPPATEGRFLEKTPIAVSLCGRRHFDTAAQVLLDILPQLNRLQLPPNSVININVPDRPYAELTGIEVTRLGHRQRSDNPVQTIPRGNATGFRRRQVAGRTVFAIDRAGFPLPRFQMDMTRSARQVQEAGAENVIPASA